MVNAISIETQNYQCEGKLRAMQKQQSHTFRILRNHTITRCLDHVLQLGLEILSLSPGSGDIDANEIKDEMIERDRNECILCVVLYLDVLRCALVMWLRVSRMFYHSVVQSKTFGLCGLRS